MLFEPVQQVCSLMKGLVQSFSDLSNCLDLGWHALSHRRACELSRHALRKASGRTTRPTIATTIYEFARPKAVANDILF